MKRLTVLISSGVIMVSQGVMAVPFDFQPGEPASAAEVNANFRSLENRLTSFDYRDFSRAENISQKVFTTTMEFCGAIEERNYTVTQNGDNSEVRVNRVRRDGTNAVCQNRVFNYLKTPTERLLVSRENWNLAGTTLNTSYVLTSPVVTRHSSMMQGQMSGSGSDVTRTFPAAPSEMAGAIIQSLVALGLENMTLIVNGSEITYSGCLKVRLSRDADSFGGSFNRISWFCPGVGEVKRIQGRAGVTNSWVLTNFTAN